MGNQMVIGHVILKGQRRDANMLRAHYLANSYLATIANY